VLGSLTFQRMNETYWGDPKVFRPERFLDEENNLIVDKLNTVMAFGTGNFYCFIIQITKSLFYGKAYMCNYLHRFLAFKIKVFVVLNGYKYFLGQRVCLGENVATSTIFTFFCGILQRFTITKAIENEFLGLQKHMTMVTSVEPFHISIQHR